jgi:hypothetical protein
MISPGTHTGQYRSTFGFEFRVVPPQEIEQAIKMQTPETARSLTPGASGSIMQLYCWLGAIMSGWQFPQSHIPLHNITIDLCVSVGLSQNRLTSLDFMTSLSGVYYMLSGPVATHIEADLNRS